MEDLNNSNLVDLIKEINYQEAYSYDKRVDLFNKYFIPTSMNFFNPIYELAKFIIDRRSYYKSDTSDYQSFNNGTYSCYSHSGAVASSFNKNFNKNHKENKSLVKIYPNGRIGILAYFRKDTVDIEYESKLILMFNTDKTISIKYNTSDIKIPRNLYDLIDEWLVDFGYNKW